MRVLRLPQEKKKTSRKNRPRDLKKKRAKKKNDEKGQEKGRDEEDGCTTSALDLAGSRLSGSGRRSGAAACPPALTKESPWVGDPRAGLPIVTPVRGR